MSLTVSNALDVPYRIQGNQKRTSHDCVFDESYPKGGESLTLSQLGLPNQMEDYNARIIDVAGTVNVANVKYDETNEKLILLDETPAEIADAANVKDVKVRFTALGV